MTKWREGQNNAKWREDKRNGGKSDMRIMAGRQVVKWREETKQPQAASTTKRVVYNITSRQERRASSRRDH